MFLKTPAAPPDGYSLRELSYSSYIPGRLVYRPEDLVPPEINNDFSHAGRGRELHFQFLIVAMS